MVSVLLLRGYDGPASLRFSFLLSIPASLGAACLVVLTTDGSPAGFRDALLDVVANGELDGMSSAAKNHVAEFELSKISSEIEKMYTDIDSRDRDQSKTH
jgi:hypothetical protein